jgi:hypothetical protein
MTTYKVADGWNVALISLNELTPQPSSTGIQPTRRIHTASGDVYDDGEYVVFNYNVLESAAQYLTVLTAFGLNNALTNQVTVYVRDDTWAWTRKNGVAVRPEMGKEARWSNFFARNITILIRDLEDAS